MPNEDTNEKTETVAHNNKTEISRNEGNITIIESKESGEQTSSCKITEKSNDVEKNNIQGFTQESATESMGKNGIIDNDRGNLTTDTGSCVASGGHVGSEEEFSNLCQPCLENDRNVDSLLYCVDCEDFLCEKCVKMHRMVKPSKTHKLVSKDELNENGDNMKLIKNVECGIHMNECIEWYCVSDDTLCCNICKSAEHKQCESIHTITSAAKTISMQAIEKKITDNQRKLNDSIEKLNEDIKNLNKDREDSLQILEKIRADTVETFQRLMRSLEKENQKVEKIYHSENDRLNDDMDNYLRIINCLNKSLALLQKQNLCVEYKFIQIKKAEQLLQMVQKSVLDIQSKALSTPIGYEKDKQYDLYLAAFQRFGFFDCDKRLYTCTNSRKIRIVHGKEEKATVHDICETGNNRILISDWNNDIIKLVDTSKGSITAKLRMQGSPFGICKVTEDAFAVTITYCSIVSFIIIRKNEYEQLIEISFFKTGEHCRGIAFKNERLFVTCGGEDDKEGPGYIKVFDLEGRILTSIKNEPFKEEIIRFPCKIAFVPGENTAIVTDRNSLLQLDFSKDQLIGIKKLNSTLSANTRYASLCFDTKGYLFIADTTSKSVKIFSKDHSRFESVVIDLKHLSRAIAFDRSNSKLYVGLLESSELLCFHLEEMKWEKSPTFA